MSLHSPAIATSEGGVPFTTIQLPSASVSRDCLDTALSRSPKSPIGSNIKAAIIAELWPSQTSKRCCEGYFEYYQECCGNFVSISKSESEYASGNNFHQGIETHRDVVEAIKVLSDSRDLSRWDIHTRLTSMFAHTGKDQLDRCMVLIVKLLSMLNVHNDSMSQGGCTATEWSETETFIELIQRCFSDTIVSANQIDEHFNAWNLKHYRHLRFALTENLCDHLKFVPKHRTVEIFHIAAYPEVVNDPSNSAHSESFSVLPSDLIEETARTIKLLFPPTHHRSRKLFRDLQGQHASSVDLLARLTSRPSRKIVDYKYWKVRLQGLLDELDKEDHATFFGLLTDTRNKQQYCTFLIAVVVLVWTLMLGIFGVWAAFKQIQIGQEQVRLAQSSVAYLEYLSYLE